MAGDAAETLHVDTSHAETSHVKAPHTTLGSELRELCALVARLRTAPRERALEALRSVDLDADEWAQWDWLALALSEGRHAALLVRPLAGICPTRAAVATSVAPFAVPTMVSALPSVLLRRVLYFLPAQELGHVACCCALWRDVAYAAPSAAGDVLPGWGSGCLLLDCVDEHGSPHSHMLSSLKPRAVAALAVGPSAVDLSDLGLARLLRATSGNLRALGLDGCDCLTDAGVAALEANESLQAVSLAGCDELSHGGIAFVLHGLCACLVALDLSYLDEADPALRLLFEARRPIPARLAAGGAASSVACEDARGERSTSPSPVLPALQSLTLSCCASFSDETAELLPAEAPCLTSLAVARCLALTDSAVACLLVRLPCLISLDVSYTTISPEGGIAALCSLRKLETVNMEGCPLCDEAAVQLLTRSLPRLRLLNVSGCDIDASLGDVTRRDVCPRSGDAAEISSAAATEGEGQLVLTPRDTPNFLLTRHCAPSIASYRQLAPRTDDAGE